MWGLFFLPSHILEPARDSFNKGWNAGRVNNFNIRISADTSSAETCSLSPYGAGAHFLVHDCAQRLNKR